MGASSRAPARVHVVLPLGVSVGGDLGSDLGESAPWRKMVHPAKNKNMSKNARIDITFLRVFPVNKVN